jgi:hypothetical protein
MKKYTLILNRGNDEKKDHAEQSLASQTLRISWYDDPWKPICGLGIPILSWISISYGTGKLKRQSPAAAVMMHVP